MARLAGESERGPLAHGWVDQRWTLARIKTLIGRLFHVSYTIEGTWRLLKRHVFEDEAGQSMTPPRARTWGRIGRTPVVRVRGRGSGRVSMAGMTCYTLGQRSRLIYAIREYRDRKDESKGFGWRDLHDLIIRARVQLGGPIVLVWDNVRLHLTAGMREFVAANAEWLTVFQLSAYAPDLTDRGHLGAGQTRPRQPGRR
ncbi:transposase [Streptomyces collinus]|uniref:transposase n=1 Tax=Streptomyces collinus TaxID=42684 RepID=UPI003690BB65